MILFEQKGRGNTAQTLAIAFEQAAQRNCPLIVASSSGPTALAALALAREKAYTHGLIIVRLVFGWPQEGVQRMPDTVAQSLRDAGVRVVTAAHALSSAERGLSKQLGGVSPVEVMAHTLRMFGAGTKVAVECAAMAYDAGLLTPGEPVVSVGGSGGGADTALLLTPAGSAQILDACIHQYYCKPYAF